MTLGMVDLDPRFDYLIVYKRDNMVNTWTLPAGTVDMNLKHMMDDKETEVLGVYKKLSEDEIKKLLVINQTTVN